MRKNFIISLITELFFSVTITNSQIEVASNGNVGIKNYNALYIHGAARTLTQFWEISK